MSEVTTQSRLKSVGVHASAWCAKRPSNPVAADVRRLKLTEIKKSEPPHVGCYEPGLRTLLVLTAFASATLSLSAGTYNVGPGQPLTTPSDVPWESLDAGDTVCIHWRAEAYCNKWVIYRQGTREHPIIVEGIPGPEGQLPVIDGKNATTRKQLNYTHEQRSVIKIGSAFGPKGTMAKHIWIRNLEIRNGRPPFEYQGRIANGKYLKFAAGIFVDEAEHVHISNCTIQNNALGINSSGLARDLLVEYCHIHSNGIEKGGMAHNCYINGIGATFQFNRFGPLRKDCQGVNFKSRAAGTVFRYNWVQGGSHCINIPESRTKAVLDDPGYRQTFVYGNVLIKDDRHANNQVIQYGGELGDPNWYRKGVLYFFNNTVIVDRSMGTVLFHVSTPDETVDCRNNIFYQARKGGNLAVLAKSAKIHVQNNWFSDNWRMTFQSHPSPTLLALNHSGTDPGFRDAATSDFHLIDGSPCVNVPGKLTDAVHSHRSIPYQYLSHQQREPRPNVDVASESIDLGAFGFKPINP